LALPCQWTKDKRDQLKRERDRKIFDLWLQCYSYREIEEKLNVDKDTISRAINNLSQNGHMAEMRHSHDFTPQLYDVFTKK